MKWEEVLHRLHPRPFPLSAGGLNLLLNFQKGGGLAGPQFLEGVAGKQWVTFQGPCNVYMKKKLKSEIFNDKKSL